MQRRPLIVCALVSLALLGGCATLDQVAVQVSSQGQWPADRKPGSYAIERLPSQQANAAEQERIEAAAIPALEQAGFVRAPLEQADVLVQVGARVFEVSRRDPFAHPFYWRHDWWMYRGYRPWFYGPPFGYGYYADDYPDYQRETAILIRDRRTQQIVYETRAFQSSRWTSDGLVQLLFQASMQDFPLPALSPRTVKLALPKG